MKTQVAVVRGEQPSKIVETALDLIGAKGLITSRDSVLIKPNYVSAQPPSTGITTDSRIVESLIEFVKAAGVREITVSEGGAGDTDRAFDVVGIRDVVARQKVKLVNLNRDSTVSVKPPQALALHEVKDRKSVV